MKKPNIDRAMGDIDSDRGANVQVPRTQKDPGVMIGSIDHANFGGINSVVRVSMEEQCPGSTVEISTDAYNDDIAQYLKGDKAELNRVRNQAFEMVDITQDNTKPPFTGRQD